MFKSCEKNTPSRITVSICVSMAGVGGIRRLLPGGTGFLAISGIIVLFFILVLLWRRDYCGPFL